MNLIETLAARLGELCIADQRVIAAEVTVHKPQAPIAARVRRRRGHRPAVSATGPGAERRRGGGQHREPEPCCRSAPNLGDRLAHLRSVVAALRPIAVSPVYETAPWGGIEQDDYLNAIVVVDDPRTDAYGWLARARELEQAAGRTRAVRGARAPSTSTSSTSTAAPNADPELTLPHPRAHERAFVLVPWADAVPDAVLPGHGRVADLAGDRSGVRRTDLELR